MKQTHVRTSRLLLAAGFALYIVGLAAAISRPATVYELSIYRATPILFWVSICLAFLVGAGVSLGAAKDVWSRAGGYALLYLCGLAVLALPLIRDYYFPGLGDPLTHLGWIKELGSGVFLPTDLLYPGGHTIAVYLNTAGGLPYRVAEQVTVIAFAMVYLLMFPLVVWKLAHWRDKQRGFAFLVGLLTALLWLPLNGISVHNAFHPFSLGMLFMPFVLYLVISYLTQDADRSSGILTPTPIGGLLAFSSVALTLIHPQAMLTFVAVIGVMAALQFLIGLSGRDHPISAHRSLYGQTAFAVGVLGVWIQQYAVASAVLSNTIDGLLSGGETAQEATQRATSLAEVGGSLPELAVKLFLPSMLFICLVAAFLLTKWFASERLKGHEYDRVAYDHVEYLAAGLVPLGLLFVAAFVANITTQHFRYLGALMLLVALLGGVALASYGSVANRQSIPATGTIVVVLVIVLLVPVSVMTLYSSPYIYQPGAHVTEAQVDGYETMLDHRDEGVTVTSVRNKYGRYIDAIRGSEQSSGADYRSESIPGPVFNTNLSEYYEDPKYVAVTQLDYEREVTLYGGFRYSDQGFRSLDRTPGIHRIQSNGDFRQYRLDGRGNETT